MIKQFTLKYVDLDNDVSILNATPIQYRFINSLQSGWCDAVTGVRILSSNDIIVFDANDDEEIVLRLTFGDRLLRF